MKEAKYHSVFKVSNFWIEHSLIVDQTPSSTPEFSPIELFISTVKDKIKNKVRKNNKIIFLNTLTLDVWIQTDSQGEKCSH